MTPFGLRFDSKPRPVQELIETYLVFTSFQRPTPHTTLTVDQRTRLTESALNAFEDTYATENASSGITEEAYAASILKELRDTDAWREITSRLHPSMTGRLELGIPRRKNP
jgi:hypothetical protein